jgi:hypothetical protein
MKVENMTSSKGNKVANQFIITDDTSVATETGIGMLPEIQPVTYFQSYDSLIVKFVGKGCPHITSRVYLDREKWDYSRTTGKYRNQFLGETKKETQAKIDSGEYILTDLN